MLWKMALCERHRCEQHRGEQPRCERHGCDWHRMRTEFTPPALMEEAETEVCTCNPSTGKKAAGPPELASEPACCHECVPASLGDPVSKIKVEKQARK